MCGTGPTAAFAATGTTGAAGLAERLAWLLASQLSGPAPLAGALPTDAYCRGNEIGMAPVRVTADMPHVNFHDLRHSCASILVGLGVYLYTISKVLWHSSVQSTQRYAHLQVEAQRAALQKIGELLDRTPW